MEHILLWKVINKHIEVSLEYTSESCKIGTDLLYLNKNNISILEDIIYPVPCRIFEGCIGTVDEFVDGSFQVISLIGIDDISDGSIKLKDISFESFKMTEKFRELLFKLIERAYENEH